MRAVMPPGRQPTPAARLDRSSRLARALAGAWAFHVGTGLTLPDALVGNTPGTLAGGAWTPAPFGWSLSCDGVNDYASMGDALDPDTGDFTLAVLAAFSAVQPDTYGGVHFGCLGGKGALGAEPGYQLYIKDADVGWQVRSATIMVECLAGAAFNDGRWRLYTGVCRRADSAGLRLYVDGLLAASGDPTVLAGVALNGTAAFGLGSHQVAGAWSFDFLGALGGAWFWARALADPEVARHARDPWGLWRTPRVAARFFGPFAPAWPVNSDLDTVSGLIAEVRDRVQDWPENKCDDEFAAPVATRLNRAALDLDAALADCQVALAEAEVNRAPAATFLVTRGGTEAPGSFADNDVDTVWHSASLPATIEIDFGAPLRLSRLVVLSTGSAGVPWTLSQVDSLGGAAGAAFGTLAADTTESLIPHYTAPARYWRLEFSPGGAGAVNLVELALYGAFEP